MEHTEKPKSSGNGGRKSTDQVGMESIVILSSDESDDDEFNDGEAAYKQFKHRRSLKRKRAAASSRKARAVHRSSMVGGRGSGPEVDRVGQRLQESTNYGYVSSDDALMVYTLPNYLQKRRSQLPELSRSP